MIKIFQIFSGRLNKYGGIKRHCIDLCSLFQSDTEVSMAMLPDNMVKYIPFIRKSYLRHLYRKLKAKDFDIIHIHGFADFSATQAIIIAKLLGKKIVYSPHFHPFQYLQHPNLGNYFSPVY